MQNVSQEEQSRLLCNLPVLPVNFWIVTIAIKLQHTSLSIVRSLLTRPMNYLPHSFREKTHDRNASLLWNASSQLLWAQKNAWVEDFSTGEKMLLCQKNIETGHFPSNWLVCIVYLQRLLLSVIAKSLR